MDYPLPKMKIFREVIAKYLYLQFEAAKLKCKSICEKEE